MKLAKGWNADLAAAPRGQSVILACVYSDDPTAWFRGEAVWEIGGNWHWIDGRPVEPTRVPKAWMDMPKVMASK